MDRPKLSISGAILWVNGRRAVDLPVVLIALLLMGMGLGYAHLSAPPSTSVQALAGALDLVLPPGWASEEAEGRFVGSPPALGSIEQEFTARRLEIEGELSPMRVDLAIARIEQDRLASGFGYRVLQTEATQLFGHATHGTHYAIVRDPPGATPGAAVLPVVVRGVDYLVVTEGGAAFLIGVSAPAERFSLEEGELAQVLLSVRIGG